MKSRAIFLDRDGVLNHPVIREGKSYPPARVEDVEVYAGLRAQLRERHSGWAAELDRVGARAGADVEQSAPRRRRPESIAGESSLRWKSPSEGFTKRGSSPSLPTPPRAPDQPITVEWLIESVPEAQEI